MNDFDDIFKSALNSHEEIPDPQLWDKIENKLDKEEASKYRKRYGMMLRAASVFIIFVCGMAVYATFLHFHNKNITVSKSNASSHASTENRNMVLLNHNGQINSSNNNNQSTAENNIAASNLSNNNIQSNSGNHSIKSTPGNEIANSNSINNNLLKNTNQDLSKTNSKTNIVSSNSISNSIATNSNNDITQLNSKSYSNSDNSSVNTLKASSNKTFFDEKTTNRSITDNEQPVLLAFIQMPKNFKTTELISAEKIAASKINISPKNISKNNKSASGKTNQFKKWNEPGRFSLTAFFSPDIAGSSLQEEYDYGNENKSQICDGEKSRFSLTTGLLAQYQLTNKWALQSGITFSALTTSIAPKIVLSAKDRDGKIKFQLPTSYGVINIKNDDNAIPQVGDSLRLANKSYLQLHYFTIPFLLKYTLFNKGRFDVNASIGGGINLITDADLEAIVPVNSNQTKENISDIEGIKKSNGSAMFGLEGLYHYNKKISFSIQPMLRYSVNSLNQNVPVKNSPYSVGFMAGITVPL